MSLNPWPYIACLILGLFIGTAGAWGLQNIRIRALQSDFDKFVADTKRAGEKAQVAADITDLKNNQLTEVADIEKDYRFIALRADNERLRNKNTGGSIVPKASENTRRPELACFDRAKFIAAIQRLDDGVFQIAQRCDEGAIRLDIGRKWAEGLTQQR